MSHYFATLTLLSPIEVKPRSGANPLSVVLYQNDVPLPVQVPPWLAERLQTQAPEGVQRVVVYPKTDPDGLLNFTVRIHPNAKGNLRRPFKLTFQTSLELLD